MKKKAPIIDTKLQLSSKKKKKNLKCENKQLVL